MNWFLFSLGCITLVMVIAAVWFGSQMLVNRAWSEKPMDEPDEDHVRKIAYELAQKKLDARGLPYRVNPHRMDVDAEMANAHNMLHQPNSNSTTS